MDTQLAWSKSSFTGDDPVAKEHTTYYRIIWDGVKDYIAPHKIVHTNPPTQLIDVSEFLRASQAGTYTVIDDQGIECTGKGYFRSPYLEIDPVNNNYNYKAIITGPEGVRNYIGIERYDETYQTDSNSACWYFWSSSAATDHQLIENTISDSVVNYIIEKTNKPTKYIKLRLLPIYSGGTSTTVMQYNYLGLVEAPKNQKENEIDKIILKEV